MMTFPSPTRREPRAPDALVYDQPAARPVEGHPIGNGRMGTLVWTTPATVEFQINRVDVFAVNRNAAGDRFYTAGATTDYGGGCARVSIAAGGDAFRPGPAFRQTLDLRGAQCDVAGEAVRASCWIAADEDVLVVRIDDERATPLPIEVTLAMWREPEVRSGAHTASYLFSPDGDCIVQTFREGDYACSSAVAVVCPGHDGPLPCVHAGAKSRTLRLAAARGTRAILIASAAGRDGHADAGAAARRILATLSAPEALRAAEERHAGWWRAFWARTFVDIQSPDRIAAQAMRDRALFLYHMAATSRGDCPPKWNGSIFLTAGDDRDWGCQFWCWTTEMLYWPLHAAGAGDLADPFFDMYRRQVPALQTAARQRWNAAGIFLPETVPFDGPVELPEELVAEFRDIFLGGAPGSGISPRLAERCRYDHHLATLLYAGGEHRGTYTYISHLASSGAELAVHAWWRYRYAGDLAWLRSHAYPLLHGVAEFYRSYARRGEDGFWHIHATNAHEDFWAVTDSIMDLAAIRGTLPLAIRAAELLDVDIALRAEWQAFLDQLAPYPMGSDPRARALTGGALADDAWAAGCLGARDGSHNCEDVQLTPIFPFEDCTLETPDAALQAVARRTLSLAPRHRAVLEGARLPTAIRSPIAAVRAGAGEELPAMLELYRAAFAPLANGFSLFEQITPGYQAHSIEHLGLLTLTLQEALLQSVSPRPGEPEVIRVFPAWPRAWDAGFCLLARGGFLVSAAIHGGQVQAVEIESQQGNECCLRAPWPQPGRVETADGTPCEYHAAPDGRVSFPTRPGGRYRVWPDSLG